MDSFDLAIRQRFANVERCQEDMHYYQTDIAIPFLRENPFSGLFADMGLGKSISVLTLLSWILSEFIHDGKILIIGPVRVVTDTWPTEIAKWAHTAWMNHTVIRVDDDDPRLTAVAKKDREGAWDRDFDRSVMLGKGMTEPEIREALDSTNKTKERYRIMGELATSPASIHLINREQVDWLCDFYQAKWPYRVVIIDESSGFKDHNSNRFKALAKMRRTPGLIERFHILTATPAAEGLIGLFTQIYLLDQGKRLGKNITAYRNRYFIQNKYSHKYELRSQSDEEVILEKIADITLVMKKKDYLPTVEPTIIQQKVKLDASQLALMKELETHFVVTLPNGVELEAKTAAALASMMLQMASGAVYETLLIGDYETEDLKKVKRVHHLHDHKIDALREIVEAAENEGRPLLVAYHWQSSLARLKKAFPQAVVMDAAGKCIKKWTAGKIPILLVHPQSAGHGLNLQYGGSTLIFFDLVYSLELYLQTIGRIDRQGQTLPVVVKMLVAEGTRDELVAECLANKEDAQDRFFATLRRLIRKLRKMAEAEDDL